MRQISRNREVWIYRGGRRPIGAPAPAVLQCHIFISNRSPRQSVVVMMAIDCTPTTMSSDRHRTEHILRYMRQVGMAEPYPTKALHPPIYPGESNWREYYRSRNLNLPHQYHNGGIWPMIGGFHVAALVRHGWLGDARRLLVALAEANLQGLDGE